MSVIAYDELAIRNPRLDIPRRRPAPGVPVTLNRNHPWAQHCAGIWLPEDNGRNLVTGNWATHRSGTKGTLGFGTNGQRGYKTPAGASGGLDPGIDYTSTPQASLCTVIHFTPRSAATDGALHTLFDARDASGSYIWHLVKWTDNVLYAGLYPNAPNYRVSVTASSWWTQYHDTVYVVSWNTGTAGTLYADGVLAGTASLTDSYARATGPLYFGGSGWASHSDAGGDIIHMIAHFASTSSVARNTSDLLRVSYDPYELLSAG